MTARHEFETMQGDEVSIGDLANATWKVMETFLDIDEGVPVFTHRLDLQHLDDLTQATIED